MNDNEVGRIITLDRRRLLCSSLALAAGAAAGPLVTPASARSATQPIQAPGFYRFTHGSADVTVVSDGQLPLKDPASVFLGGEEGEVEKLLADNFLPTDEVSLAQNIFVVRQGGKTVLFDTGMGPYNLFGPNTGRLLQSLKDAGIDVADVDAVVCSHCHIDHIGGLVGEGGAATFPKAQIYISQVDLEFWTDEDKAGPDFKAFVEAARRSLLPLRDRIVFFKDGEEFLPGVQALATPGHSVGHTCFLITSGKETLCFGGDVAHHQVLLLEQPRLEFAFDTDRTQAVESRLKVLDLLAKDRILFLSYHFAWPGVGYVGRHGDGFRFFPQPMRIGLD